MARGKAVRAATSVAVVGGIACAAVVVARYFNHSELADYATVAVCLLTFVLAGIGWWQAHETRLAREGSQRPWLLVSGFKQTAPHILAVRVKNTGGGPAFAVQSRATICPSFVQPRRSRSGALTVPGYAPAVDIKEPPSDGRGSILGPGQSMTIFAEGAPDEVYFEEPREDISGPGEAGGLGEKVGGVIVYRDVYGRRHRTWFLAEFVGDGRFEFTAEGNDAD